MEASDSQVQLNKNDSASTSARNQSDRGPAKTLRGNNLANEEKRGIIKSLKPSQDIPTLDTSHSGAQSNSDKSASPFVLTIRLRRKSKKRANSRKILAEARARRKVMRANPELRLKEKITRKRNRGEKSAEGLGKGRTRLSFLRQNPEPRQTGAQNQDSLGAGRRKRVVKIDPKIRQRNAQKRKEYREKKGAKGLEEERNRMRLLRQNPEFRQREAQKRREHRERKGVKGLEKERDRMRVLRQNKEIRQKQAQKRRENRKKKGADGLEKERNRLGVLRQNPEIGQNVAQKRRKK